MKKTPLLVIGTFTLLTAAISVAQINSGTANFMAKYATSSSISSSSLLYDNGSAILLGGVTSPLSTELFSIQKNQNAPTYMRVTNATSNTGAYAAYISTAAATTGYINASMTALSAGYTSSGISQAGTAVFSSTGILNIGTSTSNPLNFWTNNTQHMTLTSAGNLGILNTSPAYPLDVTGNTHVPSGNYYYAGTMSGSTPQYLATGTDGTHSAITAVGAPLLINYYTSQDVAVCTGPAQGYLTTGNKVEIGSPNRDATTALNLKTNGTTTALKITNSSNANIFNVDNLGNVSANATSNIYFNGVGDVNHGLGVYSTNLNSATFGGKTINGPVLYGYNGGALGSTGNGKAVALQWDNNGIVYIGGKCTNSYASLAKLEVNGSLLVGNNAGTAGIYLTQNSWADFVFDANYKLMPLNEVENYYKTNHHLPNVPTTKDIQEQGNNLGQTDAVLLQKIEELTLYMVKQQKEIEDLKKQVQKNKK